MTTLRPQKMKTKMVDNPIVIILIVLVIFWPSLGLAIHLIRRWRDRRDFIGKKIVMDGQERTIERYDSDKKVVTVDEGWETYPKSYSGSDIVFPQQSDESEEQDDLSNL